MNTFQLNCFLAVAGTLNFARAAEQLQVSQPAITHQIKSLESELNVKLFRRSTRLVEITPEGQAFITDAKNMLAIEEQAKMRFGNPAGRPMEVLSVGCSSYIQFELLTDVFHELLGSCPNLHPRLLAVPHDQLFHLLETEAADVIFDIREGVEKKDKLVYKELQQSSVVCACSSEHPLSERNEITLRELSEQKIILCDPINLSQDIARLQWKVAENRDPADVHFCNSPEAAVLLAKAGFGLAILPEILLRREEGLVKINIEESAKVSFGMFYRPSPGDTILRKFVQSAKKYFG